MIIHLGIKLTANLYPQAFSRFSIYSLRLKVIFSPTPHGGIT